LKPLIGRNVNVLNTDSAELIKPLNNL
jgi:hypothetical protein